MKRILTIVASSILVAVAFVGLKYCTFSCILPKATFGMKAICNSNKISDLYIGSSMFRQGIDTKELGENTYLLAYNSNKPFHEAMQLRYLLENGAKFDRLIVDMYPYSTARDVGIEDVKMIMDGGIAFTFELYTAMQKEGYSFATLYDLLFLQNNEVFITWPISIYLMNSRSERGANITIRHGKETDLINKKPNEIEFHHMNPIQIKGLNDIIYLCKQHGVELLFLETPKYYILNEDPVYNKMMSEYSSFLNEKKVKMILFEETKKSIGDVIDKDLVLSYPFDNTNAMNFTDIYHISYEGRQELTKVLVDLLK